MRRPTTKGDLLNAARSEHATLETLIAGLSAEQMLVSGVVGEWSVKDVLAHLAEWEQMCLGWWAASQRGERPRTPAEGFNWGQLPKLNARIYEQHRNRPLDEVLAWFELSYHEMLGTIAGISDEQLWTPGAATFTKSPLATYFISCSSGHYHWAVTEIHNGFKRLELARRATSGAA